MNGNPTAAIISIAIGQLPAILQMIRDARKQQDPNAPEMTDEQALAGLLAAVASSVAKDETWLSQHPPTDEQFRAHKQEFDQQMQAAESAARQPKT